MILKRLLYGRRCILNRRTANNDNYSIKSKKKSQDVDTYNKIHTQTQTYVFIYIAHIFIVYILRAPINYLLEKLISTYV